MNHNPNCSWPQCECDTEKGEPCMYQDPHFYIKKAKKAVEQPKASSNDAVKAERERCAQIVREFPRFIPLTPEETSKIGMMSRLARREDIALAILEGKPWHQS